MVRFINVDSGGEMWVHESRVDEYLARGHRIADEATAAMLSGSKKPPKKTGKKTGKKE